MKRVLWTKIVVCWLILLGNIQAYAAVADHKANINIKDWHSRSPMRIAAIGGHTEVLQSLVDAGADVNARDESFNTALMWVAREGQNEAVRLLKFGAHPDLPDQMGKTALTWATEKKSSHWRINLLQAAK